MDIRALQIFMEVAELRSFTRAGEKLGYSQPTISFQIKQLEQELGVQLFERIGHTVALTDPGRDALSYAQRILNLSQEMALGTHNRQEPRGVIRVAMADSLCEPLVFSGFEQFRSKYPKVAIHVHTAGTGELFRLLDHNEVDLICTMDDRVHDTNYVIADEEEIGVHFVAAADHPLAKESRIPVEKLLEYPFLLTEKGMSYRRLMDQRLAMQELEIQPVLEMGDADRICQLVGENMGLSFLPDYVTEAAVRAGTVVRLDVENFSVGVWKQLLYRRDKWVSLQMQAMVRHLAAISLTKIK